MTLMCSPQTSVSGLHIREWSADCQAGPPRDTRTASERNAMYHVVRRVLTSRSVFRMSMVFDPCWCVRCPRALWRNKHRQPIPCRRSSSCVSKKGERQVCAADTAAGVALLRSTGESSCLLGKTWGYDDAGVLGVRWLRRRICCRQHQGGERRRATLLERSSHTVNCVPTWPHSMTLRRCRTMPPASASISEPGAQSRCSPAPSGE